MERKSLVVSGIQNPALRRDTVRLRRCGRAQSQSKARRLLEGSNREHSKPKKKDGEGVLFFCVHREPTVRSCVFLRRHKAGGGFAAQNRKTHFRDSEPRFAPGYGAVAALRQGAKHVQKPEGFWRGSNREHSKPKKKDGEGVLFFCVHREPVGSLCVSVRRRKAGGDFAMRNPKTHFAETPQAKTKSTPVGVLLFLVHLQGFEPGTH